MKGKTCTDPIGTEYLRIKKEAGTKITKGRRCCSQREIRNNKSVNFDEWRGWSIYSRVIS
jgi:hypothetical protein